MGIAEAVIALIWVALALMDGKILKLKGYSDAGGILLGLCTGPLGLAVALILPDRTGHHA